MNRSLCAALSIALLACSGCSIQSEDAKPAGGGGGTLYTNGDTRSYVYSIDLATGNATKLVAGADPYLTPEGTILCVNTNTQALGEYSTDGTTFRTIVAQNDQAPFDVTYDDHFQNPQLSPSGKYVAYEGQLGYTFDVYVVDRQTGALLAGVDPKEVGVGYVRPTWTPDDRLVVGGGPNNAGLYVSDATWTTFTRFDQNLAHPDEPTVSPDGKTVAFELNGHIYTIGIDGTGLTQVTKGDGTEKGANWSPDSNELAVTDDTADTLIVARDGTVVLDLRQLNDNFVVFKEFHDGQMSWR